MTIFAGAVKRIYNKPQACIDLVERVGIMSSSKRLFKAP